MLTGYKTADFRRFLVKDMEVFFYSVLEFFFFQVIAALVDMKVAVACVTEALDDQSAFFAGLVSKRQEIRDLIDRNNNVTLVEKLRLFEDRVKKTGACCPGIFHLRSGIRDKNVDRAVVHYDLNRLLDLVVNDLFGIAVKGDQKVSVRRNTINFLREGALSDITLGSEKRFFLHEFERLRIKVRVLDQRNVGDRCLKVRERNDHACDDLRSRDDLKGQLGNDSEGSFGSDHKVDQGITGAGLGDLRAEVGDLTGRKNDGHRSYIVTGRSVFYCTHSACVCCYVTTDTGKLLARIRRIHQPLVSTVICKVLKQYARLDRNDHVIKVVGKDPVHLAHIDQDTACDRYSCTNKSRSGSSRCYRDLVFITNLNDCRYVLCTLCNDSKIRHAGTVDRHLILHIIFIDVAALIDSPLDCGLDLIDQFWSQLVVSGHSFVLL